MSLVEEDRQLGDHAHLAIRARGLVKTFQGGMTRALNALDLDVAYGDMTAIIGPSGSGKSTLLYALSGLIELDQGHVTICGETPASHAHWTRLRSRRIGLIFQDDWLLPMLTAAENVELPMLGVEPDRTARETRVRLLLDMVNAGSFGERMPAGLSGGERQRIAVARGLANRPEVLLADEPTGELDTANSLTILELLQTLHIDTGLTVMIVTHDADMASACTRRFLVRDGIGTYVP